MVLKADDPWPPWRPGLGQAMLPNSRRKQTHVGEVISPTRLKTDIFVRHNFQLIRKAIAIDVN